MYAHDDATASNWPGKRVRNRNKSVGASNDRTFTHDDFQANGEKKNDGNRKIISQSLRAKLLK